MCKIQPKNLCTYTFCNVNIDNYMHIQYYASLRIDLKEGKFV